MSERMSAEDALAKAMGTHVRHVCGLIADLNFYGYAITPIVIDEGAVEKAADGMVAICTKYVAENRAGFRDDPMGWDAAPDNVIARAAISTYLEAIRAALNPKAAEGPSNITEHHNV